jgi:hypothetical protein
VVTDLQLSLIIPIFVIAYKKKYLGNSLILFAIIGDGALSAWTCWEYKLRAGILAEENWYIFAYLLQKPWGKIGSVCVGVYFAKLYMGLLEYRMCPK